MNEKLMFKIQRKQKTIVSDEPLYRYGYWRQGYTKGGKERWVLREFQHSQNHKCYGGNQNVIRGKLINETWDEYHNYLQKLLPKYKKASGADKERTNKYNSYRKNIALRYEHY